MYKLTERRMVKVQPILEAYRGELRCYGTFDADRFESAMKAALDTGYQEMKSVADQLLKNDRFCAVAVFYMENMGVPGPCVEFQHSLAKVYGLRYYEDPQQDEARANLWKRLKSELNSDP